MCVMNEVIFSMFFYAFYYFFEYVFLSFYLSVLNEQHCILFGHEFEYVTFNDTRSSFFKYSVAFCIGHKSCTYSSRNLHILFSIERKQRSSWRVDISFKIGDHKIFLQENARKLQFCKKQFSTNKIFSMKFLSISAVLEI